MRLHRGLGRAVWLGAATSVAGVFLPTWIATGLFVFLVASAVLMPDRVVRWVYVGCCTSLAVFGVQHGGVLPILALGVAFAVAFSIGVRGWARWTAAASGLIGGAACSIVQLAAESSASLDLLSPGFRALVVGSAGGFLIGVGAVGRHLRSRADAPATAPPPSGEVSTLLQRAMDAHRDLGAGLPESATEARRLSDQLVQRMEAFARRCVRIDADLERLSSTWEADAHRLDGQILASTDEEARNELVRTRETLRRRDERVRGVRRERERCMARLTSQLASLEHLRAACIQHRSAETTRFGSDLDLLVEEIGRVGADLEVDADAITEATQLSLVSVPVQSSPGSKAS